MLLRQNFYGFRIHVRLAWSGVITRFSLVPANVQELRVVYELVDNTLGFIWETATSGLPKKKKSLDRGRCNWMFLSAMRAGILSLSVVG